MTLLGYIRDSMAKSAYMPADELAAYAGGIAVSHALDLFTNTPRPGSPTAGT